MSLTPNRLSCWVGFGTLDPPGLPASYCSPSVLQQARNCWPSEVLYWCVQSPGSHYTSVIRPTNLTRGLTDGLMIYSLSFTILSQPSPQATPSPSRAPMINCGSLLMVLSKLQELVQLAGFFSAKLRGRQITRFPCKIKVLSIAARNKTTQPLHH